MTYLRRRMAGALLLAIAMTGLGATAASATTTESYLLFAWEITSTNPNNHFETPQEYVAHVETTSRSLDQHDPSIFTAGRCYQIDLYLDVAESRALIRAQLFAPGNPHEPWPGGRYESSFSRVFCVDDAIQPPAEETPGSEEAKDCATDTITMRSWVDVVRYSGDKHGYTAQAPVREQEITTIRPADDVECPSVVVPPPTELAHAGPSDWVPGAMLGGALTLVGIFLVFRRRIAGFMDRMQFGEVGV